MIADSLFRRAGLHSALADAHRLAIIDELTISDRSPSEIAGTLGLGSNLLAHHLDVLDKAGLVERTESHGDKRRRYLRLRRHLLGELLPPVQLSADHIVFVCTANSARSQLASAIWNEAHMVPAESAGTKPAQRVHPEAIRIARRIGVDLSEAKPRGLELSRLGSALVVTVCDQAHEELAGLASLRVVHWSVADPAAAGGRKSFEQAASEITGRVQEFAPLVAPVP